MEIVYTLEYIKRSTKFIETRPKTLSAVAKDVGHNIQILPNTKTQVSCYIQHWVKDTKMN